MAQGNAYQAYAQELECRGLGLVCFDGPIFSACLGRAGLSVVDYIKVVLMSL